MNTLVERMGELRLISFETPATVQPYQPGSAKEGKEVALPPSPPTLSGIGFWMRGFGNGMHINDQVSRAFDQTVGGFQIGGDKHFSAFRGDLYIGGFLGYYYASRDFLDGGDGTTNAFSLGAYATWIHRQSWYADMVVKYTQLWNDFNTPTLGEGGMVSTANYSIPTFGGSLEVGRRWDVGKLFLSHKPNWQAPGQAE
jgi:outer membrane autotransporter protein